MLKLAVIVYCLWVELAATLNEFIREQQCHLVITTTYSLLYLLVSFTVDVFNSSIWLDRTPMVWTKNTKSKHSDSDFFTKDQLINELSITL